MLTRISSSLEPLTVTEMFRSLVLLCVCAAALGALPKGWKACSKGDSKYSQCLDKEIENAIKSLTIGDKKLGVLPLDPLRIEKLEIGKGTGPVAIQLTLISANINGIKDVKITNVKNDWKTLTADVYFPQLRVLSDYKVNGKVLVLPITGQGKCNLTFDQLKIKAEIKWKEVQKGNTKHINMESITLPLQPKRLYFNLENLFNGDKALGDNMNKFLNENWEQILDELRKPISEALTLAFIQISNQVLNKIPASEIDIK